MYTKIVSTLCIIFFILFVWAYISNENYKASSKNDHHTIALLQKDINDLEHIVSTDRAILIDKDFTETLTIYNDLYKKLNNSQYQPIVKERIEYLESISTNDSKISLLKKNYDNQTLKNESVISLLKAQIDQNKKDSEHTIDSLSRDVTSLNEMYTLAKKEIASVRKELTKNEKVKVISFKNAKGNKIHYLGDVSNNKANGGGIGIWSTGSIYKGEWKDNLRHGYGTFEWADGEKYEGEYKNDIRSGEGTYHWPSGERYFGEWENDKRNGYGTVYDKDGNITYKGQWLNDKIADSKN